MPADRKIEVCGLNISATPHPAGIYIEMLRQASRHEAPYRGSEWAKITSPREYERADGIYTGRILVWTEIDVDGRWIDKSRGDELSSESKRGIVIPHNARPNYRTFNYVFDERRHHFWFESLNEFGQRLGPTSAQRLMSRLLEEPSVARDDWPEIHVVIVPEDGALRQILDIPNLSILTIRVDKPNPDGASAAAKRRVFDQLDQAHSKRIEMRLTKEAGAEKLELPSELRDYAEVGAEDGFVRGKGRDEDGRPRTLSTDDYPRRIQVSMDAGSSFVSRLRSVLRF